MSEESLLGVSYLESDPDSEFVGVEDEAISPYERAKQEATDALEATRQRLIDLRKAREGINAEIKTLVEEEDLLSRMAKVRKSTKA